MRAMYRKIRAGQDGPWSRASARDLRRLHKLEKAGYVTVIYGDDAPMVAIPTPEGETWYAEGPVRFLRGLGRRLLGFLRALV